MSAIRNTLIALGFMGLGAVGIVALPAVAGPGQGSRAEALTEAGFSQEQIAELQAMREERRQTAESMRAMRQVDRDEMVRALKGEIPLDSVHDNIDERLAVRAAEAHLRVEQLVDFAQSLEPEQREVFVERFANGGPGRRGPGMRGPRGRCQGPAGRPGMRGPRRGGPDQPMGPGMRPRRGGPGQGDLAVPQP